MTMISPSLLIIAWLSLSLPYCLAYSSVKANSWQKRLDRALVDIDGSRSAQGRVRSLQRALQDPKLQKDVSKAIRVVRKKGFGKGHPQFIELLWPRGTVARSDIEGLQALVTKQLPERWEEVQKYDGETISAFVRAPSSSSSSSSSALLVAPQPNAVLNELFGRVRDKPDRALKLAQNALRSSPKEVESPAYKKIQTIAPEEKQEASLETIPIVEIRQYEAYQAVSCTLQSKSFSLENMGAGLNRLFSYLVLGDNVENMIMEMTTPFIMQTDDDDDDAITTMTVKLPSANSEVPPLPSSDAVSITEVPGVTLATLPFLGICTDPEIERQTESLLEILEEDGKWEVVSGAIARVLQYNAPGTLPWRRKNEIGIAVVEKEETEEKTEDEDAVLSMNTTVVEEETSTEPVDADVVMKVEEEGADVSTTD